MANILLAEDDTSMRQFLVAALEKAGHRVVSCSNGLEAMNALLEHDAKSFDLLLSDIVMPGIDGIELSGRANKLNPSLKVLFITGFAAVAAQKTDEADILAKPFHLSQLLTRVSEILAA